MGEYTGPERRAYPRITVRYVTSYKHQGLTSYDITQVTSISQGGLLFISSKNFNKGDILKMNIRLPYAPHKLEITGEVVVCKEIAEVYETRIKFVYLDAETFKEIGKLVEKNKR